MASPTFVIFKFSFTLINILDENEGYDNQGMRQVNQSEPTRHD